MKGSCSDSVLVNGDGQLVRDRVLPLPKIHRLHDSAYVSLELPFSNNIIPHRVPLEGFAVAVRFGERIKFVIEEKSKNRGFRMINSGIFSLAIHTRSSQSSGS